MKTVARDVVRTFYKDHINPTLEFDHNSEQLIELVQGNVNKLIKESVFHMGLTLDVNVSFF